MPFDRAPLMSFGAGPAVLETVVRVLTAALVLALIIGYTEGIEALAAAAPDLPWPVVLAGDWHDPEGRGSAPSGVHCTGRLDGAALRSEYGRASIFCLPARYEPFGLAALEAAAFSVAALRDERGIPWDKLTVFHMDEYIGLSADHPASFRRYIREKIAEVFQPKAVHYINGDTDNTGAELVRYTTLLSILGGLDVPSAGRVTVAGHDLLAMDADERQSRADKLRETVRGASVRQWFIDQVEDALTALATQAKNASTSATPEAVTSE